MKKVNSRERIIVVILFLIIFLIFDNLFIKSNNSFITGNEVSNDEVYYLPIIETTDIHGYIVDISSGSEDTYEYRLSYIANDIKNKRKEGDLLLVDTGDSYQGNVISNRLDGTPVKAYYDALKYDGICIGNHEFDWNLKPVMDGDLPILCYNLYYKNNKEKVIDAQDYIIVNKKARSLAGSEKEVKIALFGYINDYSSSISNEKIEPYEIHEEDIFEIEDIARNLESSGKADISVIISHVSPDDMDEIFNFDSVIDLVACGHSHKTATGELSNNVPYILGGCYGQDYAEATFVIKDNDVSLEDKKVVSVISDRSKLYDNKENKGYLDEEILKISHEALGEINDKYPDTLDQMGFISKSAVDEPLEGSIHEDIATNFAASLIANAAGVEVGVINSTGVRSEIKVLKNEKFHYITGADIDTMLPFDDPIAVYELTYEELFKLCGETYLNSHSYLGISGVEVYYENGDSRKVKTLFLNGKKIYDNGWIADKDSFVFVAVSEYVSEFNGSVFKELKPNEIKPVPMRESVKEYLKNNYGKDKEIPVDDSIHLHNS